MPISPRASPIGLPALRASSVASSSRRSLDRVGETAQQRGPVRRGRPRARRERPPWPGRPLRRPPPPRPAAPRPSPSRSPARSPRSRSPPPPAACCSAATRATKAPREASTRAAIRRLSRSSSGCQSTPRAKRLPGSSIASIRSSCTDQPLTRRPSPSRSTPWWWWDLTARRSAPGRRAGERVRARAAPRARRSVPGARAVHLVAERLGQVLDRGCRRAATLSSCMPRQIPSTGMSRSSARRVSASSKRSRSGQVPFVCGVGLGAVAGRVDVGAAGQHQAVDPVEQEVGVLDRRRSGGRTMPQAAGALHGGRRRFAAPASPRSRSRHPTRPARSRRRCRSRGRSSESLEAPETLPVGDRRLEGLDLDPGPVQVVVDDLLAERLARPASPAANASRAS